MSSLWLSYDRDIVSHKRELKRRKSKTNKDKRAYNSRTEKEENLHYECDSICFDCCGSFDLVFWN